MTTAHAVATFNAPRGRERITAAGLLRSEWRKLWTIRSLWLTLSAAFVMTIGLCSYMIIDGTTLGGADAAHIPFGWTGIYPVGMLVLVVFGVLSVSTEYASGSIRTSLTVAPRRTGVLLAKAAVVTGVSAILAAATTVLVLLVDDQALHRMGMRMFLTGQDGLEVVGEAADGDEAIGRSRDLRPDVVVMDVRMPGTDGIEATRRIVSDAPEVRVLLLTTFDLDEYVIEGLKAGASGFLTKDAEPSDILSAIRSVAAGDAVIAPSATRRLLSRLAAGVARQVESSSSARTAVAKLSPREHEIFVEITRGATNSEIAATLHLAESTVKSNVGRIFARIGARDRVHAVILGFQAGVLSGLAEQ